jgi:hypothetical protein
MSWFNVASLLISAYGAYSNSQKKDSGGGGGGPTTINMMGATGTPDMPGAATTGQTKASTGYPAMNFTPGQFQMNPQQYSLQDYLRNYINPSQGSAGGMFPAAAKQAPMPAANMLGGSTQNPLLQSSQSGAGNQQFYDFLSQWMQLMGGGGNAARPSLQQQL